VGGIYKNKIVLTFCRFNHLLFVTCMSLVTYMSHVQGFRSKRYRILLTFTLFEDQVRTTQ